MTMLCKLLSHSSNFPAALLVLWNLTGGTGHADNLEPYLASNAAFGLFFALSSAFCDVASAMWFVGFGVNDHMSVKTGGHLRDLSLYAATTPMERLT